MFSVLDEEKYKRFHHIYCRYFEAFMLPKIWSDHAAKLSKDRIFEKLMSHWDSFNLSWTQNDILEGKTLNNILI